MCSWEDGIIETTELRHVAFKNLSLQGAKKKLLTLDPIFSIFVKNSVEHDVAGSVQKLEA